MLDRYANKAITNTAPRVGRMEGVRQIKTIHMPIGQETLFDETVNIALREGWKLVKRYVITLKGHPGTLLVAELQRWVSEE